MGRDRSAAILLVSRARSSVASLTPPDMPTKDFIDKYMDIYTNANFTTWAEAGEWNVLAWNHD